MLRSYKLDRNYTNTHINIMESLRPQRVHRQIGENKWEDARHLLRRRGDSVLLVNAHYAYEVNSATWVPTILEKTTIHVLERCGDRRYLRHTIEISGKKWRQNDLENEENLARWILQHPSAIERIHTEEWTGPGVMSSL